MKEYRIVERGDWWVVQYRRWFSWRDVTEYARFRGPKTFYSVEEACKFIRAQQKMERDLSSPTVVEWWSTPAGVTRDEVQQMLDKSNRELCEKIEALGHRVFEVSLEVGRKPARKR